MDATLHHLNLLPRQQKKTPAQEFISLIQDPFSNQFATAAFWSSLATALGTTLFLGLFFSILRPHHAAVYAPRLKRAQGHHAPPPLGKGILAWVTPVRKTREAQLIDAIGLDATIFLRFTRMCRNMFLAMSIVGCGVLIPANVYGRAKTLELKGFMLMTPSTVWGKPLWAQVISSWIFSLIIAGFLWFNYRHVTRLRRAYFESPDYQARLHSRTLLVTDIPKAYRTDEGVYQISDGTRSTSTLPRSVIGRNVKGLSELIRQHEETVRLLESYLAKYLKNPHKLPASRPMCKPAKGDHSYSRRQKVDAIEYLTERMQRLELEIQRGRDNIDMRNPMPYGFSSYNTMPEAHAAAYRARRKHKKGVTVKLAPAPEDIIWDNLPLSKASRRWKKFTNTLWVALLTVIWIAPNAMIAIFLSNLNNLGRVIPSLMAPLQRNWKSWAVVQGVAAPAILSLFYLLLPILFRRLSIRAGDTTKTSRERHVVHQLYAFFIFNNLVVFTIFSAIFQFVSAVVKATKDRQNAWDAIRAGEFGAKLLSALCNVSLFWVTWLLQRNLGAAVDLSQLFNLLWIWFAKTFMAPTPRQREEWTRPPPFDYASYYNYFLFYATVALCFATLQPIVLPVTALYFALDSWLKKYLLMYVFYTKTESGGQFWRVVFNRMIFATILSNITVILIVFARDQLMMVYTMAPLPLLMLLFKLYCKRAFDDDIHFYCKSLSDAQRSAAPPSKATLRRENLAGRFENPAFWKPLMAPMVLEEAKGVLAQTYRGRLQSASNATGSNGIHLESMSEVHPGKSSQEGGPSMNFKFIPESLLDNPSAHRGDHHHPDSGSDYFSGADSAYDGRPIDLISERPDTPGSYFSHKPQYPPSHYDYSRTSSPAPSSVGYEGNSPYHHPHAQHQDPHAPPMPPLNRQFSAGSSGGPVGTTYPPHYHHPPYRTDSPHRQQQAYPPTTLGAQGLYAHGNESRSGLLRSAADMPSSSSPYS